MENQENYNASSFDDLIRQINEINTRYSKRTWNTF